MFEHSMDAVLLTSPDGRIIMANAACEAMLGYTEAELQRLGRQAVVEPSDPRLRAGLEERRRTGRFRGEITMKRKDGCHIEVELSSAVFLDEQGAEWTTMFIRDISSRKAHEAERERLLAERDAERGWLRAVLEHVPVGVILFDEHRRLSFNRRTEELLGMRLSPQRGAAQYQDRIRYPDGTPVPPGELVSARVLRSGETVAAAEFIIERPDGTRIPVLGSAGPITDESGKMIGAVGVFQDISERMRAAELIRTNERLLHGIFELLPVGVWIADRSGRIVRTNPAGLRIWAGARYVGPDQFGEYRAWWVDTGKLIEPEEWALARALHKGETSIGEIIRIQCFDGTFKTIINSALPLHDERGEFSGAIVINDDVTSLIETQAALRRAVESREQVLEVVAHDLRSPLHVMHVQLEMLLRDTGAVTAAQLVAALHRMARQVKRMDQLIQDLLDITRVQSGSFALVRKAVTAESLVREILENHEQIATALSLQLREDIQGQLPHVYADRPRVIQVLENLVVNAEKFTRPGGHVTVGAAQRGPDVLFWVADTGIGMEPQMLERVFDRLWQAGTDRRGVGLGLSIAKAIVEAHGGRIWAESAAGRGSTFFFTLPTSA